jgi:DNA primase
MPKGLVEATLKQLDIEVEYQEGDELWALCPGHESRLGRADHNPSWSINIRQGMSYCFSCGYKSSLSSLVYDLAGPEAASSLRAGVRTPPVVEGYRVRRDASTERFFRGTEEVKPLAESALALYDVPPEEAMVARHLTHAAAGHLGVLWDSKVSAWILPLRWPRDNRLMGWQVKGQRKRIFRNYPIRVPKAKTLFGYPQVRESDSVVLVESPLDAVRLVGMGYQSVALCGSKVSLSQMDLLSHFDRVVLALDNDDAGQEETRRLVRSTPPFKYSVIRYHGPSKDVGEMEEPDVRAALEAVRV